MLMMLILVFRATVQFNLSLPLTYSSGKVYAKVNIGTPPLTISSQLISFPNYSMLCDSTKKKSATQKVIQKRNFEGDAVVSDNLNFFNGTLNVPDFYFFLPKKCEEKEEKNFVSLSRVQSYKDNWLLKLLLDNKLIYKHIYTIRPYSSEKGTLYFGQQPKDFYPNVEHFFCEVNDFYITWVCNLSRIEVLGFPYQLSTSRTKIHVSFEFNEPINVAMCDFLDFVVDKLNILLNGQCELVLIEKSTRKIICKNKNILSTDRGFQFFFETGTFKLNLTISDFFTPEGVSKFRCDPKQREYIFGLEFLKNFVSVFDEEQKRVYLYRIPNESNATTKPFFAKYILIAGIIFMLVSTFILFFQKRVREEPE